MLRLIKKLLQKLGFFKEPVIPVRKESSVEELLTRNDNIRNIYEQNKPKDVAVDTGKIICSRCRKEQKTVYDDFIFDVDSKTYVCEECWENDSNAL